MLELGKVELEANREAETSTFSCGSQIRSTMKLPMGGRLEG